MYLYRLCFFLLFSVWFVAVFPQRAFAYIDPATGSIVFQVVAGAFLGGLFAVKKFWRRIKAYFQRLFRRGNNCDAE